MDETRLPPGDGAQKADDLTLLDELAQGEDEFDVDLMACGCRVAPATKLALGIQDVIRLFHLSDEQKVTLIGALVDEAKISPDQLIELADKVARGDLVEPSLEVKNRAKILRE